MTDPRPTLTLAHSPDPDDAFMWWPLIDRDGDPPRIDTGGFRYRTIHDDIEALNRRAVEDGDLDITAMSCAVYPHVTTRYAITACGASLGDNYGPKLVARPGLTIDDLRDPARIVAVPGERTSAFGMLSLILGRGGFRYEVRPFDEIIEVVADGTYDAGLVIHEGQLTFGAAGLDLVLDVGCWWTKQTDLPMPLGVNAVRRDLAERYGDGTLEMITSTLRRSVEYALSHREESVAYALGFARDMGADLADQFIELYVNRMTLDFGDRGRRAVGLFLGRLAEAGLAPATGEIDFIAAVEGEAQAR